MKKHPDGYLILDDTVVGKDKDSWKTEMAAMFWSSSSKRYLYGQSVVLLIWTDGETRVLRHRYDGGYTILCTRWRENET